MKPSSPLLKSSHSLEADVPTLLPFCLQKTRRSYLWDIIFAILLLQNNLLLSRYMCRIPSPMQMAQAFSSFPTEVFDIEVQHDLASS